MWPLLSEQWGDELAEGRVSVTWHRMIHERLIAFAGVSLSVLFSDSVAAQRGDEPIVGRSHTLVGQ